MPVMPGPNGNANSAPSPDPSSSPTAQPSATPSPQPSGMPTPQPSAAPSPTPTPEPSPSPSPTPMPQPKLLLGVSDGGTFRELADGDEIEVHRGSQGGIHIFLSFQIEDFTDADTLLIDQRLTFVDNGTPAAPAVELPNSLFEAGENHVELLDYLVFLFGSQGTARDRLVDVDITISDADGLLNVAASVRLRFVDAT